ncbi:MAG: hypothetical protein J6K39_03915 [Clostridia bacterium]|nr:hypothetical protein [Clostridia bacterium]
MTKLEIEVVGFNTALNMMTANGKYVKLKKHDNRTRTCVVEPEQKTVDVVIYKSHAYTGKCWFWWNLLYFIISIFGIFDVRQEKRCLCVDCRFKIDVEKDSKVTLKILNFEDGGKVLEIESEAKVEELSNVQGYDKEAQKKHKKMNKAKIGIVAGVIILSVVLIILL